jgi:phage terminase large subunit
MLKCAVDRINKKLYWKEEIYKTSLSTKELGDIIVSREVGDKLIVADSAASRTILDLKARGLNIEGVHKGLVVDDIKMLWDYEIIVDPEESFNLQRNLNNWIWLDKKGEIPIDIEDDLIDAGRYYTHRIIKPGAPRKGHKIL